MYEKRIIFSFKILLFLLSISISSNCFSNINANHLVSGILSYTTWEPAIKQINFCIIDGKPDAISNQIFNPPSSLLIPSVVKTNYLTSNQILNTSTTNISSICNVFYFVNTVDHLQQKIINHSPNKILTISENNTECAIGSAFCIYKMHQTYRFKVNLDSLKQTNIKVNAKVLLLSQQQEEMK